MRVTLTNSVLEEIATEDGPVYIFIPADSVGYVVEARPNGVMVVWDHVILGKETVKEWEWFVPAAALKTAPPKVAWHRDAPPIKPVKRPA